MRPEPTKLSDNGWLYLADLVHFDLSDSSTTTKALGWLGTHYRATIHGQQHRSEVPELHSYPNLRKSPEALLGNTGTCEDCTSLS
jgi:hypothetical protein